MTQTPHFIVNSPVSGTAYTADQATYEFIPNSGTSYTVTVECWSGANGTGSLVVRTITAIDHNVTSNTDPNSSSGSGNNWTASSSNGTNGSNVFCGKGSYSGAAIGSLVIYADYTGVAVAQVFINTGTPASPVWTAVDGSSVLVNTGTPASPVWTAVDGTLINTGTPGSPSWN